MKTFRNALTALSLVTVLIASAFAQNPATQGSASGRYGMSAWAINNQRVASLYNYDLDSVWSQGAALGLFQFPAMSCQQALAFGGNRNVNPFNTNASVKVVDVNSSQTETVALTAVTISGGTCSLSLSTSNTHGTDSYHLRSGTCGLQEAINDLGANGGEVIVDQKFYDDGCTQATVTGLNPLVTSTSGPVRSNVYVHDISNGQDTWFNIKPSTLSLIAAAVAPTNTQAAGGALTLTGTYLTSCEYVDPVGGLSLPATDSATLTLTGSNQTAVETGCPAATGAVGWIPMITASGGSAGTEIEVPVTSSVCTLSTLENIKPACAIGATATIAANPSSTAKEVVEGTAHSAFAFTPIGGAPNFASTGLGVPQTSYGPFAAVSTISAAASADVAQFYLPPGAMNFLGRTIDICFKANYSITSTGIPTFKLNVANQYAQSPVTLATVVQVTQAAAVSGTGCFHVTTAATGTSGTFMTDANITQTLNSSGAGTVAGDVTTAASSAVDLTKQTYWSLNVGATTASVTAFTTNSLTIRQAAGN